SEHEDFVHARDRHHVELDVNVPCLEITEQGLVGRDFAAPESLIRAFAHVTSVHDRPQPPAWTPVIGVAHAEVIAEEGGRRTGGPMVARLGGGSVMAAPVARELAA